MEAMDILADRVATVVISVVAQHRGRRTSGTRRSARTRVSTDAVVEAAKSFGDLFTAADLQAKSGGSPGTIRKVLNDLVAAGQLGELDPDPDYAGRGRAPGRFKTT